MTRTILAATDFSELATAAVHEAANIAAERGAELVIVYAENYEPPAEFTSSQIDALMKEIDHSRRRVAKELAEYAKQHVPATVATRTIVVDGAPAPSIVRAAEAVGAELIVMGTHGRTGLQKLVMGSVAESVMRDSAIPVKAVPRVTAVRS